MVTIGNHGGAYALKNGSSVVFHHAGLAVHDPVGANHLAAKCCANCLMAETDAQNGNLSRKPLDQLDSDPGFIWRARSRRDDDLARPELLHLFDRNLIIAADLDLFPRLTDILHEVEGERIVVVENENHTEAAKLLSF